MSYSVIVTWRAQKELTALPAAAFERVASAIAALASEPRPAGCIKLTGLQAWHIRSGDYRVIYEINDSQSLVTVIQTGNRRDVYR